ncbi:MAG: 50S ribosomal protein L29 [Firmicutes bacterium]|nr:50S ribosomal protein L29 [Bacillota bacterium]MDY3659071.1 50S ribosomal protein L29 [Eubacteriales bacterium]
MKLNDIKNLTTEELITKEQELKAELFNLRFSHATGNLANPMQLHNLKKDIARVKTIIREREMKKVNG